MQDETKADISILRRIITAKSAKRASPSFHSEQYICHIWLLCSSIDGSGALPPRHFPSPRTISYGKFQFGEKAEGSLEMCLTLLSSFTDRTDVEGAVSVKTLEFFHAVTLGINSLEFLSCVLRAIVWGSGGSGSAHYFEDDRLPLASLEPSWFEQSTVV